MLGLYAIAFLAPLAVFGLFAYFIVSLHAQKKIFVANPRAALTFFVYIPIAISYGIIFVVATLDFIQYLQKL